MQIESCVVSGLCQHVKASQARSHIISAVLFILISSVILCSIMTCRVYGLPEDPEVGVAEPEVSSQSVVLFEDPYESDKIDDALDWCCIDDCELTAYCSCYECSEGYGGVTASGVIAQANHTIAVDPDVIPLGSWVEINGHQYHAEDVGGGVNGNHIDIYFDSHDVAVEFGRQVANVRWYE